MFIFRRYVHEILVLLAFISLPAAAQNFNDAMDDYNAGEFGKARTQFLALTASEPSNDALLLYRFMRPEAE